MLEKDPAARYVSAGQLEQALTACTAHEWNEEQSERWWRDHPRDLTEGTDLQMRALVMGND